MPDDQIIAVVTAHKEGKKIQIYYNGEWKDITGFKWDFSNFDYRIKPPESISIPATMHELKAIKSVDWYKRKSNNILMCVVSANYRDFNDITPGRDLKFNPENK